MLINMTIRDDRMMNNQHEEEKKQQQRQGKKQKHNKKVSFIGLRMCEVLHIKNYTNEERHACWYSKEEKLALKYEVKVIAKQMMMNNNLQDLETRGLEAYKSEEQFCLKQRTRKFSSLSVLKTQRLYKQGQCDYDTMSNLSNIYVRCSQQSSKDAYLLAIQYQSEEQQQQSKVVHTTTTTCRINNQPHQLCSKAA